ncbi:transposase [Candidatus Enterovibrio escicola]|uniref:Mobile element protein n=2 Tax=Candidatus Enterovibrio escicola TaxID=1927127 RepID=A0A2A5T1A7_9GAMM|nr:Mobile element protein [Candidatus Enterovibrio escacola]
MNVPLKPLHTPALVMRSRTVEIKYHLPNQGAIDHVDIDTTGLKVYDKGKSKTRKYGKEKRRIWRKLHLSVDVFTHEIIAAEVSLVSVGDNEILPILFNQLRRKIQLSHC